jgi:large subunit ribosomal protein L9
MKVYLLKDIPKLGRKGEIKEVKDGFALNYLLPQKLAVIVDDFLIKELERKKQIQKEKEEKEKEEKMILKKKIEEMVLTIPLRFFKESGEAYDAVNKKRIKEELKKYNIEIEENEISLEKSLKKEGTYTVPLNLGYQIKADLKIKIVPLKE